MPSADLTSVLTLAAIAAVLVAVMRWSGGRFFDDLEDFAMWRAERHETWSRRWLAVSRWARRW